MSKPFNKFADKAEDNSTSVTMMGPTCREWMSWPVAQRLAYLRGYLEAELFYRGVMSVQWKGKFGPAIDRAIDHVDFNWPTPDRTLNEEESAITRFYEDVRNQHVLFFPARRYVMLQLAGYPPSFVREVALRIRKAQMDDPNFPDRLLKKRKPSLEELEALSSSRALDDEESWLRIQLTASEKGPDAALPLLDTFLATHPVHAHAFFLRGRILLGKNDIKGVRDLERTVEIDPTALADSFELIAGFHHRNHNLEEAQAYAGPALQFRTVMDAAECERVSIDKDDALIPHGLTDDILSIMREQLQQIPAIEACFLAQKAVRFFVDRHFYLLGVVADKVEDPTDRDRKNTELMLRIKQQIILPDYTFVVVFDESSKLLQEKTQAMESSMLYTRSL